MKAEQEHNHCVVIVWILASIILLFLWACAGCGTLTGVVDDGKDIIDHARTHVK